MQCKKINVLVVVIIVSVKASFHPNISMSIWEEKQKKLALKNISESASDSTKNKIPNNQTLGCTGRGLANNSKNFTKNKLKSFTGGNFFKMAQLNCQFDEKTDT